LLPVSLTLSAREEAEREMKPFLEAFVNTTDSKASQLSEAKSFQEVMRSLVRHAMPEEYHALESTDAEPKQHSAPAPEVNVVYKQDTGDRYQQEVDVGELQKAFEPEEAARENLRAEAHKDAYRDQAISDHFDMREVDNILDEIRRERRESFGPKNQNRTVSKERLHYWQKWAKNLSLPSRNQRKYRRNLDSEPKGSEVRFSLGSESSEGSVGFEDEIVNADEKTQMRFLSRVARERICKNTTHPTKTQQELSERMKGVTDFFDHSGDEELASRLSSPGIAEEVKKLRQECQNWTSSTDDYSSRFR